MRRCFSLPGLPALPALLILGFSASACGSKQPVDEAGYVDAIARGRAAKDADFQSGGDSPVPEKRRAEFLPLPYFPIDPAYSVPASLKPSADKTIVTMPTSVGAQREMRRVGTLEFAVKGQPLKLTAFVEVG